MSSVSENGEFPTIDHVFRLIDKWRHLPGYALERRADIFFALFLPEVLEKHCDIKVKHPLIPEFPIDKETENNRYRQADYFALSENDQKGNQRGILVELKTDMASKRSAKGKKQECSLIKTAEKGMWHLVKDAITIIKGKRRKQERQEYIHLLSYLKELELVCYKEKELYKIAFSDSSKGIYDIFEGVEPASWVCGDRPKLEALYIQPDRYDKTKDKTEVVDFETFADVVERGRGNEEMRKLFAKYLRSWACIKAGSPKPGTCNHDPASPI